jgi:hypothetical protein
MSLGNKQSESGEHLDMRGTVSRNRRNSTGSHRRAPHPRLVLLMLLLAIELCEDGSTPLTLLIVSVSISISTSRILRRWESRRVFLNSSPTINRILEIKHSQAE